MAQTAVKQQDARAQLCPLAAFLRNFAHEIFGVIDFYWTWGVQSHNASCDSEPANCVTCACLELSRCLCMKCFFCAKIWIILNTFPLEWNCWQIQTCLPPWQDEVAVAACAHLFFASVAFTGPSNPLTLLSTKAGCSLSIVCNVKFNPVPNSTPYPGQRTWWPEHGRSSESLAENMIFS